MVQKVPYSPDGGTRMPMSEMGQKHRSSRLVSAAGVPQ